MRLRRFFSVVQHVPNGRVTMSTLARPEDTVAPDRATVHVIDDDASPREALSLLFPSVGLEVRTYASVQEFLDAGEHDGLGCILLERPPARHQRARFSITTRWFWRPSSHRPDDRTQRRSDVGSRHEGRRRRFPAEAVPRPGHDRCGEGGDRARPGATRVRQRFAGYLGSIGLCAHFIACFAQRGQMLWHISGPVSHRPSLPKLLLDSRAHRCRHLRP
jgi:hypothetical protein